MESTESIAGGDTLHSHQNDAVTISLVAVDQFTEILVLGEDDLSLGFRFIEEIVVGRLSAGLRRVEHVISSASEPRDDRSRNVLVGEDAHGERPEAFYWYMDSSKARLSAAY